MTAQWGARAPGAESRAQAQNDAAVKLLFAGNFAEALEVLRQAISIGPPTASMWVNVAGAFRGLKRAADEMEALREALKVDPRHLGALLQMASLLETQGKSRDAAATYRTALQMFPRGAEPPPEMRPILQHAKAVVDANDVALENFLAQRLQGLRTIHADEPMGRFDRCLDTLLRKRRIYRPQPTFMYFPNLPSIEFYDRSEFPWLDAIEAATDDIRTELVGALADGPAELEPYIQLSEMTPLDQWGELNHSRRWSVYYLWREGVPIRQHLARCPRTAAALEGTPRCDVPGYSPSALFSILDAKTRIPAHTGVSNTRLIVHLPLIVPSGCGFRVGAEQREWQPGHALVFDDTIEHEVWNDNDVPRAVLIFDIWNPYLSAAERDMVRVTTAAVGEYYGKNAYNES